MSTISRNKELAQANRRAAERARKVGKKMQADTLKKLGGKRDEQKVCRKKNGK